MAWKEIPSPRPTHTHHTQAPVLLFWDGYIKSYGTHLKNSHILAIFQSSWIKYHWPKHFKSFWVPPQSYPQRRSGFLFKSLQSISSPGVSLDYFILTAMYRLEENTVAWKLGTMLVEVTWQTEQKLILKKSRKEISLKFSHYSKNRTSHLQILGVTVNQPKKMTVKIQLVVSLWSVDIHWQGQKPPLPQQSIVMSCKLGQVAWAVNFPEPTYPIQILLKLPCESQIT